MSRYQGMGAFISDELLKSPLTGHAHCVHASPERMETLLGSFVSDPQVTALSEHRNSYGGCLTGLAADSVRVGYVTFGEPVTVQLWHQRCFGCVVPLRGRARLEQYPAPLQGSNGPFFLLPQSDQHWQLSSDCELLVIRVCLEPEAGSRMMELLTQPHEGDGRMACAQVMMASLPYRLHHGLGYADKLKLLQQIRREFLQLFGFFPEQAVVAQGPQVMDPRVSRAMEYLRQLPARSYDLDSVCEIAHISRRGLYYAFGRNLDCTPYAYFRACHLVRVRLSLLLDAQCNHAIASHASACGFQHMGRFAADYRAHFGERPSETRERAARSLSA